MDDRELANRLEKIQSGINLILDRTGFFDENSQQVEQNEERHKRGFESRREE